MTTGTSLNNNEWKIYDSTQELAKDATHIFKIVIDKYYKGLPSNYAAILSEEERAKAKRFVNKKDTERFIVSRHALRSILAKFLLRDPAAISFHQSGNKKPATEGIEFNSTHSQNIILVAVSPLAVGIDIEFIDPGFDFSILKADCFSPEEQQQINSHQRFYALWTRKEAILKATGEGLLDDLKAVACLDSTIVRKNLPFHITTYPIEQQYIFSLATVAHGQQVYFWSFYY